MLEKVCCILDIDGFDIRVYDEFCCSYTTEFMVRELGYVKIDPTCDYLPKSYRFDLTRKMKLVKTTPEVRQTLYFQSKHVIGLPITPGRNERDCIQYECLEKVLKDIYYFCQRSGANVVAYKGGEKEKNILERLEIPSVDLQCFGCPSFKDLIKFGRVYSALRDCGHHTELKKGKLMHCPKAEVIAYRDWYKMHYERYR
ncbi:uncharacterized protein TNCV_4455741 [Trichonephila clavipes]|nr:uncharacterized protein TNCV_4455741 [Trichonephila clavipes]